jgi:hypothetical protein
MNRTAKAALLSGVLAFVWSNLCAASPFTAADSTSVELTGLITCSRCLDLAQHKGFTPWTWAMYQVSRGDDIVIKASSGAIYRLQGDRSLLTKYVGDKAIVTGDIVDARQTVDVRDLAATNNSGFDTIAVESISRPAKKK